MTRAVATIIEYDLPGKAGSQVLLSIAVRSQLVAASRDADRLAGGWWLVAGEQLRDYLSRFRSSYELVASVTYVTPSIYICVQVTHLTMSNPFATPLASLKSKHPSPAMNTDDTLSSPHYQLAKPPIAGTWRSLHFTIDLPRDSNYKDVATFLNQDYDQYKQLLDLFAPPSESSKAQVLASSKGDTSIVLDGAPIAVQPEEANFVLSMSNLLKIDEIIALAITRSYVRDEVLDPHGSVRPGVAKSAIRYNDELMDKVAEYYFDERTECLAVIAALLRTAQDEGHQYFEIASSIVGRLRSDSLLARVLRQFKESADRKISDLVEGSPRRLSLWTRQLLKEQKALLDILFHMFFLVPEPHDVVKTMEVLTDVYFGRKQASAQFFDESSGKVLQQVCEMCVVVALELLNLEEVLNMDLMGDDVFQLSPPRNETLLSTPAALVQITKLLQNVANPLARESQAQMYANDAAPVLLAWAAYGFQIAEPIKDADESYQPVVDVMTSKRPDEDTTFVPSIFLNVAQHVGALQYIHDFLKGPLCQDESPSKHAYKYVVKGLLMLLAVAVPESIRPQLNQVLECMSEIYTGFDSVAKQFWVEDYQMEERRDIIDWPRSRFPFTAVPLIRLLTALTSSSTATYVYRYFKSLPTFTASVDDRALVYDPFTTNQRSFNEVRSNQPIPTTPFASPALNMIIPAGTSGYRLSVASDLQVQFQYEYSGWHWCLSVIDSYLNTPDRNLDNDTIELVGSIMDLMGAVFAVGGDLLVTQVMSHFCQFPAQGPALTTNDVVTFICRTLSRSCLLSKPPPQLITSSLKCIVELLPHYPNSTWNHLRQDPFMPRYSVIRNSNSAASTGFVQAVVLPNERQEGRYGTIIAFLDLVLKLVTHARKLSELTSPQVELITGCVLFIRSDIYSTYSTWRYVKTIQKHEIGTKVISVFNLILKDVTYARGYALKQNSNRKDMSRVFQQLADSFLNDGDGRVVRPMIAVIKNGQQFVATLYHRTRQREGDAVQDLITQSLEVLLELLRLRAYVSSERRNPGLSPLEMYLLDKSTRSSPTDFIRQLGLYSRFVTGEYVPSLAVQVLALLCVAAKSIEAGGGGSPSFLGYFGVDAPQICAALVQFLVHPFYGPTIQVPVWNFMTAVIQTQPALSSLLLKGNLTAVTVAIENGLDGRVSGSVASTGNGPAGGSSKERDDYSVEENTGFYALIEALSNWKSCIMTRPQVLVAATAFMSALWQEGSKYRGLLNKLRSKADDFWLPLLELLKHRPTPLVDDVEAATMQEKDIVNNDQPNRGSTQDVAVKKHCASLLAKSHIIRTLSRELQISPTNLKSEVPTTMLKDVYGAKAVRQQPVATNYGSSSANTSILQPPAPPQILTIPLPFQKFAFDPQLHSHLLDAASQYPDHSINLSVFRFLPWHPELDAQRQPGDSYMFDLALLDAKLVSGEAKEEFLARVCASNHNWSVTDAQLYLLRAWSNLLQIATIRLPVLYGESEDVRLQVLSRALYDMSVKLVEYAGAEYPFMVYKTILGQAMVALVDSWSEIATAKCNLLRSPLTGPDAKLVKNIHQQIVEILDSLSQALSCAENSDGSSTLVEVEDGVAVRFTTLLLSATLRGVQSLVDVVKPLKMDPRLMARLEVILNGMMTISCSNLSILLSGAAASDGSKDVIQTKELHLLLSLVSELARQFQHTPTVTIHILERWHIIPGLLHALVTTFAAPPDQQPTNLEVILCCLSTFSHCAASAERLAVHGVLTAFTQNAFAARIEEGSVRPYASIRLNTWHQAWLAMLSIVTECTIHLGHSLEFVQGVAVFANLYRQQLANALKPGTVDDTITMGEVLETRHITRFFWALTVNSIEWRRVVIASDNSNQSRDHQLIGMIKAVADAYQQAALELIPSLLWRFNHRKLVGSKVIAVTVDESDRLEVNSALQTPEGAVKRLVVDAFNEYLVISYYVLSAIAVSTDSTCILYTMDNQAEWNYGNQVIPPDLTTDGHNGVGIGTIMELMSAIMEYKFDVTLAGGTAGTESRRASVLSQGLALVATQLALFMYSPEYSNDVKRHIQSLVFSDVRRCLESVKNRIRSSTQAVTVEQVRDELRSDLSLVEAVERFIKERVFLTSDI
ncbi:hypothetical protein SeLEV6574_g04645 [Synchytrium endobioticum]|uniref:Nucleoporin NUP188 n=1 Tax=Synchytrium endobioticum TaxID=286115 RepID=A0A507CYE1_9FUNG|nr:hypothetical protein SeLEV6574_g04645 [Synchytrium endobioticum]